MLLGSCAQYMLHLRQPLDNLRVEYRFIIRLSSILCMLLQFRLVAVSDFAKQMTWPELVPALKEAIQSSDLVNGTGTSELKTLNVLIGLQTIIKPFQVCVRICQLNAYMEVYFISTIGKYRYQFTMVRRSNYM